MSRTDSLRREIALLTKQVDRQYNTAHSWAFILLNDADIPPERAARIKPHDTVYIKRIIQHG